MNNLLYLLKSYQDRSLNYFKAISDYNNFILNSNCGHPVQYALIHNELIVKVYEAWTFLAGAYTVFVSRLTSDITLEIEMDDVVTICVPGFNGISLVPIMDWDGTQTYPYVENRGLDTFTVNLGGLIDGTIVVIGPKVYQIANGEIKQITHDYVVSHLMSNIPMKSA